jgi:hypothetical protein
MPHAFESEFVRRAIAATAAAHEGRVGNRNTGGRPPKRTSARYPGIPASDPGQSEILAYPVGPQRTITVRIGYLYNQDIGPHEWETGGHALARPATNSTMHCAFAYA